MNEIQGFVVFLVSRSDAQHAMILKTAIQTTKYNETHEKMGHSVTYLTHLTHLTHFPFRVFGVFRGSNCFFQDDAPWKLKIS